MNFRAKKESGDGNLHPNRLVLWQLAWFEREHGRLGRAISSSLPGKLAVCRPQRSGSSDGSVFSLPMTACRKSLPCAVTGTPTGLPINYYSWLRLPIGIGGHSPSRAGGAQGFGRIARSDGPPGRQRDQFSPSGRVTPITDKQAVAHLTHSARCAATIDHHRMRDLISWPRRSWNTRDRDETPGVHRVC